MFITNSMFHSFFSFYHKHLLLLIGAAILSAAVFSQSLSGYVTNADGKPLSHASVYVKGSSKGTITNGDGFYLLPLQPGQYNIVCAYVGYQKMEKKITIDSAAHELNFSLYEQQTELAAVTVKAGAEDPAYAIIRNAIKQRRKHYNEVNQWRAMVYMKGLVRTKQVPRRILGMKLQINNDIIDSSGKGILYFSESLTNYSRRLPNEYKEQVISAKVSGSSQGFGFNSPRDIELNLYQNNIAIEGISRRGFISPINDNALYYYRYKFDGTFYEDGKEISRIKIIARRKYEPCFTTGYITILEGSWRIHSADLYLTKESQMEVVDSLHITQQMFPIDGEHWMPQQTHMDAGFGLLGFQAAASFGAVYSDYETGSDLQTMFKSRVVKTIDTAANKKTVQYWDSLRPIPLTAEERLDYLKKDTLEKKMKDPRYLDSLDKMNNKIGVMKLLARGTNIIDRKSKTFYDFPALIKAIQYNTVEGWVINFASSVQHWADTGAFTIKPVIRYGLQNKHLNASIAVNTTLGKNYKKRWELSLQGGKAISQINPANPIDPFVNTIGTLLLTRNYMKIYEKGFGQIGLKHSFMNGWQVNGSISYEDRTPLQNTDTTSVWHKVDGRHFTSNYPGEIAPGYFIRHQALLTTIRFVWQPGQKFVQYPQRMYSLGSKMPVFSLLITKAWKNVLGTDADFGKWQFSVHDGLNMKLGGSLNYDFSMGGFTRNENVQLPDWQNFRGNQTLVAAPYGKSFQLANYYANSTMDKFFSAGHVEWHLNGLLTNKIPLVRRFNLGLVTGGNAFYVDNRRNNVEVFFGIENILKAIRIDFVTGYEGFTKSPRQRLIIGFNGLFTGGDY